MVRISHPLRDRSYEGAYQYDEKKREPPYEEKGCGEYPARVLVLLVCESEEGCLHSESEDNQDEGRIGVQVRDDPVSSACGGEGRGVQGNQQVVEEASYNTADSVDGGILRQVLHIGHSPSFFVL